jgi:hypothetical protein
VKLFEVNFAFIDHVQQGLSGQFDEFHNGPFDRQGISLSIVDDPVAVGPAGAKMKGV